MRPDQLRPGAVVRGAALPEPVEVVAVVPLGEAVKLIGKGLGTGRLHDPVLTPAMLDPLEERALAHDAMESSRVVQVREEMERAGARRLQPHHVEPFFLEAFQRQGGCGAG